MELRVKRGSAAALGLGVLLLLGCSRGRQTSSEAISSWDTGRPSRGSRPEGEARPPAAEAPTEWEQPARRGPAVLLSVKRVPGKPLVYEGDLTRRQEGKNKYVETDRFYLTLTSNGRTAEGYDRVALVRAFLDRSYKETLENGKTQERLLENSTDFVNLGPNCEYVANQRCYAFDAQNRVAYRSEEEVLRKDGTVVRGTITAQEEQAVTVQTADGSLRMARAEIQTIRAAPMPHVLHFDTPHYFFPIFSRNPVAPGDTWVFRVPVIVPVPQVAGGSWLPSQFEVRMVGRLREVRGAGEELLAVVDYRFAGSFDSADEAYKERFDPVFRERNHVRHEIDGEGTVELLVAQGRLISKVERFRVRLEAATLTIGKPSEPPRRDQSWAEVTSQLSLKWLPPGTLLRNGTKVPPCE